MPSDIQSVLGLNRRTVPGWEKWSDSFMELAFELALEGWKRLTGGGGGVRTVHKIPAKISQRL